MEISFLSKQIKDICENSDIAKRKLGNLSAKKLRNRIADLLAVSVVTELVAGNPHPLKGNRLGEFSLRLDAGHRLVFVSNMEKPTTDWAKVTKVKIIFIGDYHD